ncbi:SulP family inorganic anion transporter [Methanococcus maripaludis]|jgi:SulP family sulfate permease|uniref:Sulphate transporter n=2 Tax=Methanococcus maripaludis TaxID=39152 RepID=A0A2Z5PKH8_METMI|nr:sulfate permease [Methanococcus maripaludis]AEK19648.1 sulfate transporter family protein [Methanococcus maripaludis X1]MDK2929713.1 sulfate permease, SulP family [Methanococcus sp.]BAP62655.1 sulphate transporter [Methanococcus maripaludis OS7]
MKINNNLNYENLKNDLFAGFTIAIVALPLAMAFAIASGVSPEKGLFTAIIAGFLISVFGGSKYQIGGPTGAFVVILYGIIASYGYEGLVIATLMAGVILIIMGLLKLGNIIKFIPYPVTMGFTSGIALIIFSTQVKDFFGLSITNVPASFLGQWITYATNIQLLNPYALLISILSLFILTNSKKVFSKIPSPIIAIAVGIFLVYAFNLPVETIESKFGQIPNSIPFPSLPELNFQKMELLFPSALSIAFLGAIESLMCAVVADGMTGYKHNSNKELIGQGIANIGSVFFGGIPATGALARTATNIKAGATSRLSGIIHSVMLFLFMLLLSPLILKIPLATLSAILVVVAWNMAEVKHFKSILFKSPKRDRIVLLVTFLLTIFVNLNTAIQIGMLLAVIVFMQRLIEVSEISNLKTIPQEEDPYSITLKDVPPCIEVYEINGPFFFGIADKFKSTLNVVAKRKPSAIILRMRNVPIIDSTGIKNLEEFIESSKIQNISLIISGADYKLRAKFEKYGLTDKIGNENICENIDLALVRAKEIIKIKHPETGLCPK